VISSPPPELGAMKSCTAKIQPNLGRIDATRLARSMAPLASIDDMLNPFLEVFDATLPVPRVLPGLHQHADHPPADRPFSHHDVEHPAPSSPVPHIAPVNDNEGEDKDDHEIQGIPTSPIPYIAPIDDDTLPGLMVPVNLNALTDHLDHNNHPDHPDHPDFPDHRDPHDPHDLRDDGGDLCGESEGRREERPPAEVMPSAAGETKTKMLLVPYLERWLACKDAERDSGLKADDSWAMNVVIVDDLGHLLAPHAQSTTNDALEAPTPPVHRSNPMLDRRLISLYLRLYEHYPQCTYFVHMARETNLACFVEGMQGLVFSS